MVGEGPDRRQLLQLLGASSLLRFAGGCGNDAAPVDLPPDATFDDLLDIIHTYDVEYGGGLSSHAPMAAEALVTMGLVDQVVPFLGTYLSRLPPFESDPPLAEADRAAALGDPDRRFAWIAAYLEDPASPAELIARDWPLLSPGYSAVHGVLRAAHALRSLDRADTPSRRRELAFALGYFASDYFTLPGEPGSAVETGLDVVAALEAVPLVPKSDRVDGLILERLAVLEGRSEFAAAVAAVDLDALPIEMAINALAAASARLFVADGANDIVYLHCITGTSALRLVLPHLDAATARASLGHAFQMVAASHAVSAGAPGIPATVAAPTLDEAALSARASSSTNEHRIKLTEACLREHAVSPLPEFLSAAERTHDL